MREFTEHTKRRDKTIDRQTLTKAAKFACLLLSSVAASSWTKDETVKFTTKERSAGDRSPQKSNETDGRRAGGRGRQGVGRGEGARGERKGRFGWLDGENETTNTNGDG